MSTTTAALAKRDAAFAQALQDLTRGRNIALDTYPLKERARDPAVGDYFAAACERAKEKYRAARALAQKEYLAATASPAPAEEGEWEAGL